MKTPPSSRPIKGTNEDEGVESSALPLHLPYKKTASRCDYFHWKDIALPFNGGTPALNYLCRNTFIELLAGDHCRNRCRLAPNADSLKTGASEAVSRSSQLNVDKGHYIAILMACQPGLPKIHAKNNLSCRMFGLLRPFKQFFAHLCAFRSFITCFYVHIR